MLLTFQDTVERLVDYMGAQAGDSVLRDAKQAAIEALRDLAQSHTWTYLFRHGRLLLSASYDDGTITYLVSSGAVPNQVVLVGGTWPPWAKLGVIRIANINYEVSKAIDGNTLQLVSGQAPADDITTPTEYALFQDSYSLPGDFSTLDQTFIPLVLGDLRYVHPREWLWETANWGVIGNPLVYTIMADPDLGGRLGIRFAPFPTAPYPVEFLYKRRPNPLGIFKESDGAISGTSGSASITGAGTSFTGAMVNSCVLRVSGKAATPKNPNLPTAEFGDNPAVFESKIIGRTSASEIETWDQAPADYANMPYTISAFVDIETGAMEQAYLRCCEMHISMSRVLKDRPSARNQYHEALEVAKCADSRNNLPRVAGPPLAFRRRLKDYPINLSTEG